MQAVKILFLCHRVPFPPNEGGKIRSFNMIRHLHDQGHQVTVASMARNDPEMADAQGLRAYCHDLMLAQVNELSQKIKMVARLFCLDPSSMGYFHSAPLIREVNDRIKHENFDLIIVHCSSVAPYVADVTDIPKLLDFADMDSQKWLIYSKIKKWPLSWGYWLEGSKLLRAEKKQSLQYDMCTTTTEAETDTLDDYNTGAASGWFPNGVDTDYFSPDDTAHNPYEISFVGKMNYYPNEEAVVFFCDEVLPRLRDKNKRISFTIIGARPSPTVQKLGEREGVTVTGFVEDVRDYLRQSALMVAPLNIARGVQNKILEAMSLGIPVVSSVLAGKGVDCVPEEHFLTADSPAEYVTQIMRILDDPLLHRQLAEAGRARMLSHHRWPSAMAKMDRLIDAAIDNHKNR